jgi:sentrin-specific protease 1
MKMLEERDAALCAQNPQRKPSFYFNSFFMEKLLASGYSYSSVKRWSKKFDAFAMDKIFFPINISNTHWTFAVVYMTKKKIAYYDSMSGTGKNYTDALLKWLVDEARDKKNMVLNTDEWSIIQDHRGNIPQQKNGFDCGVFATIGIDFLSDDLPLQYNQGNMATFRLKMAADILRGSLTYPV